MPDITIEKTRCYSDRKSTTTPMSAPHGMVTGPAMQFSVVTETLSSAHTGWVKKASKAIKAAAVVFSFIFSSDKSLRFDEKSAFKAFLPRQDFKFGAPNKGIETNKRIA